MSLVLPEQHQQFQVRVNHFTESTKYRHIVYSTFCASSIPTLMASARSSQLSTSYQPVFTLTGLSCRYALTEIKGVGRRYSNIVCKKADVDLKKR